MVYIGVSAVVGLLSPRWQDRILPWVFVIPAMVLLTVYLVYPTIGTIITSFTVQTDGDPLANYKQLTSPLFLAIIRNNIIWLIVGTGGTVLLGLLFAGLFDRVRRESLAKTFIFLPLAISFVGASVIWRFMYEWKPAGSAPDRHGQCCLDGTGPGSGPLGAGPADQHLRADLHLHLAPDRLRHGRPLGRHQGRLDGGHRGGPP